MANTNFIVRNGLSIPAGNITLGNNASISTDATSGALALIPAPTPTYPNPVGIVISAAGTLSTVQTVNGITTTTAIDTSANAAAATGSTVSSSGSSTTYRVDLDSIISDGFTNLYPLYYNNAYISVPSPWNLNVFVDGTRQPGFFSNIDVTWASYVNSARLGYTLDNTYYTFVYNNAASGTVSSNTITVTGNISSVKPGMLAVGTGIATNCVVTDVNTVTGVVTLNEALQSTIASSSVTFSITCLRFADAPQPGSVIDISTSPGVQNPVLRTYPFRALDVMMGVI